MALVTLDEILKESLEKHYAVGAFDTLDEMTTEAVLSAAEELQVPVILMVSDYSFTIPRADSFMENTINRCRRSSIPVCLHLDHGSSFEAVMQAIHYGCTSVMIDGSSLPYQDNIELTKKVVEVTHACGVSVESEIGHVAGHEQDVESQHTADEKAYTRLENAVDFYQKTKVDALAVAFGTVHGVYKGTPILNYDLLDSIRKEVPVPLVMHGGSGLQDNDYLNVVKHGINKINFYTAMSLAGSEAIREYLKDRKQADYNEAIEEGQNAEKKIVLKHLKLFGTQLLSAQ